MKSENNGGETDYWSLPKSSVPLNDLIEFKEMSFAQGSIFKACYRLGDVRHHSTKERDLYKIIYYAQRMLEDLEKKNE